MLSIKGTYNNGQIILDESPEITRPVQVIITFLEAIEPAPPKKALDLNKFSFNKAREILKDFDGSLSDAIIEERRTSL